MRKNLPLITLISTLYMMLGSFLIVAVFGFNVTNELDPPPVPFYLEPAGYAFVIWAFIYLGYIALGIYQFHPDRRNSLAFIKARPYIILNALANSLWFVGVIQKQLWLTVLCMFTLLVTLIAIALYLELGKPGKNIQERLMVKLPIALYFGWITAAAPINTTSWLVTEIGWTGQEVLTPEIWSTIILVIAFAIFLFTFFSQRVNATYLLVGVWALFAIYVANSAVSQLVGMSALVFALGLGAIFLYARWKKLGTYFLV